MKTQANDLPTTGYVRQSALLKAVPFSSTTLWRKVKDGTFPKPVKLSTRITAWRAEDLHAWINNPQTYESKS